MRRMRNGLALRAIPELAAALFDLRRVHRLDAPELLGEREVDRGLLVRRVEVEQDDFLRREAGENRVADGALVAGGVEAGEEAAELVALGADARELLALRDLESVEGGEGLELDQFRGGFAGGVLRDGEVDDGEDGEFIGAGHVEVRRHGGEGTVQRLGVESCAKMSREAETISSRSSGGRKKGVSARWNGISIPPRSESRRL